MRLIAIIAALFLAGSAFAQQKPSPAYARNFGNPCPGTAALCKPVPLSPKVYYNFLSGQVPDDLTFTRASVGWYFNSAGVLTQAATNAPRFDYNPATLAARGILLEHASSNYIRNNSMVGAVAGTPGTLPSRWSYSLDGGFSSQIAAIGTESGINYIDIRISGTAGATGTSKILFEPTLANTIGNFQPAAVSGFLKLISGSLSNITAINYSMDGYAANGNTLVSTYSSPNITPTSSGLATQRFAGYVQVPGTTPNITNVQPYLGISYNSGAAIDVTLRIGLPQLEGTFAAPFNVTSPMITTGIVVTRAVDSLIGTPAWFNNSLGAFVINGDFGPFLPLPGPERYPLLFSNGVGTNAIGIRVEFPSSGGGFGFITNSSVTTSSGRTQPFAAPFSAGINYITGNNRFVVNGLLDGTGAMQAATVPSGINKIEFTNQINVEWLSSFRFYDSRLTDAQLQTITAR